MRIKVGDTVVIIAGKDKGKQGEVLVTFAKKDSVIVKDCNMITKHIKKTKEAAGERIEKEAPLHVSNVMVMDGETASRVRYVSDKKGKKARELVKTNKTLS